MADRYLELVAEESGGRVQARVCEEYELAVDRILAISEKPALLDDSPELRESLSLRNPWMDPLSHIQVELLSRDRGGDEEARQPLLSTIAGIAAGMQKTG